MILADRRHPHLYNFIICSNKKNKKPQKKQVTEKLEQET